MPYLNNKISHRLGGVLGLQLLAMLAIVGMALWQMGPCARSARTYQTTGCPVSRS